MVSIVNLTTNSLEWSVGGGGGGRSVGRGRSGGRGEMGEEGGVANYLIPVKLKLP